MTLTRPGTQPVPPQRTEANVEQFKDGVAEKLKYYVYRLIDPRNGLTFYVGKGRDDRVFQHVRGVLKPGRGESRETIKGGLIQDILDAGLEPHHIIHRHGMEDDKTAYQVEAAVMDAFSMNLTNEAGGHGSDKFGPCTVEQLNERHKPEYIPEDLPVVVIKITRQSVKKQNGSHYEAVRASWRMSRSRFEKINARDHHVAAILERRCVGLYSVPAGGWTQAVLESKDDKPRYEFSGERATDEMWNRYVRKWFDTTQWPVRLVGFSSEPSSSAA